VLDGEDGSFDLTAFKTCLKENDMEPPRVDMERHGAIGRFWMCAWRHPSSPRGKRWARGDRQQEYSEAPQVGSCSNHLNSIAPVEGFSSEMSNGDNQNPVASGLVNEPGMEISWFYIGEFFWKAWSRLQGTLISD
jgi:hypothetical protein